MPRRPGSGGPVRSEFPDHIKVRVHLVCGPTTTTVGVTLTGPKEFRELLEACKAGKPFLGELCSFTNTQDARVAAVEPFDPKLVAGILAAKG